MLKKMKKQNQGFTLVEVVVSMLVLSIISVTILTAFTQAAKANTKSRKVQDAEKVLINFSEYLEAGGDCDFGSFAKTGISNTVTGDVTEYTLTGVSQGFNSFKVVVKKDTNPIKYRTSAYNTYEEINLGDPRNSSMLFDAVSKTVDFDADALVTFHSIHENEIQRLNDESTNHSTYATPGEKFTGAGASHDPNHGNGFGHGNPGTGDGKYHFTNVTSKKLFDQEDKSMISREIVVEVKDYPADNQYSLSVRFRYKLADNVVVEDSNGNGSTDDEHIREYIIGESVNFDYTSNTNPSALHLENIYILYYPNSPFSGTEYTEDINFIGDVSKLNGNLFIAYQEAGAVPDMDDVIAKSIEQRVGAAAKVKVRCSSAPTKLDIYSSSKIDVVGTSSGTTKHENNLVATKQNVRTIVYNIQVIDASGKVMATNETTYINK